MLDILAGACLSAPKFSRFGALLTDDRTVKDAAMLVYVRNSESPPDRKSSGLSYTPTFWRT